MSKINSISLLSLMMMMMMMMMMMVMVMMTMLPGLFGSGDDDVLVSLISLVRDDSLGPHIVRWPQWTPYRSVQCPLPSQASENPRWGGWRHMLTMMMMGLESSGHHSRMSCTQSPAEPRACKMLTQQGCVTTRSQHDLQH